jgi:putative transcriptional regulator
MFKKSSSEQKGRVVNRIREFREDLGLTQQELAGRAGVSRQSVISIEKGHYVPSLTLALKLGEIFSCATDELFRLEETGNG